MMKRYSLLIAVLAALSLVFTGCSSAGGSGDTAGISAPDMGGASDLAASGGTAPGSTDAALALFTAACNALNTEIVANAPAASIRALKTARATTPINETIDVNFSPSGGGTVAYTGSYTGSITMPDDTWTPSPNSTYNDIVAVILNATVNGTLTNVVVSDTSYTYTINGIVKNEMSESANLDLTVGSTEGSSTIDLDFALGIGIGTAISVKRGPDNVGAKFLITYGANYAQNNIDVSTMSESTFSTEMADYLTSQPATLTVYNDSNEIVYETTITANDAFAASILSHFGN